mgnify:CR=1 FL=1
MVHLSSPPIVTTVLSSAEKRIAVNVDACACPSTGACDGVECAAGKGSW